MTSPPAAELSDAQVIRRAADLIRHWHIGQAHVLLAATIRDCGPQLRPLHRATIVRLFADTCRELGDLKLAVPLLQQCQGQFGPSHPVTVRAAVTVAALHYEVGDDHHADLALIRVLSEPDVSLVGPLAREAILAATYRTLIGIRRGADTVTQLQQRLDECRIVLGPQDPLTIRLTIHLAHLYATSGRADNGARLLQDVRTEVVTGHGDDHPLVVHLTQAIDSWTPQPAPASAAATPRASRRPRSPIIAAVLAGLLALSVCGVVAATHGTPGTAPVATWNSPTPTVPPAVVHVAVHDRTVTITFTYPASEATATLIVTVGGIIRRTITLPPTVDRQTLTGIGPGQVCAAVTWNCGDTMLATAAACSREAS
ncbi:hypothetical protein HDA40_002073 [Hamadaea flava]|uniref:Tetratricopeptide repeat protein n=1 Tax=Hamadaea flava TaxID=1742688 RepID=A0ABV8LJG8_9ACTN|nr:tetratricopeptide repeat protein [Hamadaea flava]MCP2323566.1 hypothetical protein [Hamadaea flava]